MGLRIEASGPDRFGINWLVALTRRVDGITGQALKVPCLFGRDRERRKSKPVQNDREICPLTSRLVYYKKVRYSHKKILMLIL